MHRRPANPERDVGPPDETGCLPATDCQAFQYPLTGPEDLNT
jgi:hypothetical protein